MPGGSLGLYEAGQAMLISDEATLSSSYCREYFVLRCMSESSRGAAACEPLSTGFRNVAAPGAAEGSPTAEKRRFG